MTPESPSDRICTVLVDQMLSSGAGWHMASVRQAARRAGVSDDEVALALPGGVSDLIVFMSQQADRDAQAVIKATDMRTMSIRDRIRFAVRTRLDIHADRPPEAIRAVALGAAAPWRIMTAPGVLWATSDMIWHAIGDTSTDGNWYSKRMTLSAVLAASILPWLRGDTDAAWSRLDQAIDQVMLIEKCKQRIGNPLNGLARMIFGTSGPAVRP